MVDSPDFMLNTLRGSFIKVCTRCSVGIAFAFGLNAVTFVWLQNKLEISIARDEAQIALQDTLIKEQSYVSTINENYNGCKQKRQASCLELAKNIVIRNSRLYDLEDFFKEYPFKVSSEHGLIKNIKYTIDNIDIIAKKGFGTSLEEAYSKGIKNAESYSRYVKLQAKGDLARRITSADLDSNVNQIINNVYFMRGWNSENISESRIVEENSINTWRSLTALILFELVLYVLVSSSDFWLTNIPPKNKVVHTMKFIRTKTAIPMMGVILFGFISVLISQRIVYVELERTVLEGCRRINRNAIFTYNTNSEIEGKWKNAKHNTYELPSYCIKKVVSDPQIHLEHGYSDREIILLYSTKISELQEEKSDESSRLALSLLIFNTLTMACNAVKLNYENIDIDES